MAAATLTSTAAAATTAQTDPVLTNEQLKTSIMIDTFLDYANAFIYDSGLKRHWIVYNIASIKAADLEILAQQLAAEHRVERTTMLRALLATVSLRERGWQEPSAAPLRVSPSRAYRHQPSLYSLHYSALTSLLFGER